jgi:hypothetical protein
MAAIDAALGAWTQVSGATIVLQRGGATDPMPMLCDGIADRLQRSVRRIPNPGHCSGVLAIGGSHRRQTEIDVIDGVQYRRIIEGNITFSNGFGKCPFWTETNLAEITTHEIGHTIGIGHASELDDEPSAVLKDATMYYRAHFDGRGASVRPDDVAAVRALYAGGTEPPDPDIDRDGVSDDVDNCPGSDPTLGLANPSQSDLDGDGIGDGCDPCPLSKDNTSCGQLLGSRVRAVIAATATSNGRPWSTHRSARTTSRWPAWCSCLAMACSSTATRAVTPAAAGQSLRTPPGQSQDEVPQRERHAVLGAVKPEGFRVRLRVRPFTTPTTRRCRWSS